MRGEIRRVEISVPGKPVPEPKRKSLFPPGKGGPITIWRDRIGLAAEMAMREAKFLPFQGIVDYWALFLFPRPGRLLWKSREMPRLYVPQTPDVTNLVKAAEDSFKHIVWKDDCQVVSQKPRKAFAAAVWVPEEGQFQEEPCRALITVRELREDAPVEILSSFERDPFGFWERGGED